MADMVAATAIQDVVEAASPSGDPPDGASDLASTGLVEGAAEPSSIIIPPVLGATLGEAVSGGDKMPVK